MLLKGVGRDRSWRMSGSAGRTHEAAAIASRQGNQRRHLFSVCARSVTKFMRRTSKKDWADALKKRV